MRDLIRDRFNFSNPLLYRYIPRDSELLDKLISYVNLSILNRLTKIVSEIVSPRICSLEYRLMDIAVTNKQKQISKRIDGQVVGLISIDNIFKVYTDRLKERHQKIDNSTLEFNINEAIRNDKLSDLAYFLISAFSIEANIANDVRHHFRSEIGEFTFKDFAEERVGSSTMPHKRNPAEYENIVGLWKAYMPRVPSFIMAQITEHQGDSTNNFLPDGVFELAVALSYSTKSLENSLENLKINT